MKADRPRMLVTEFERLARHAAKTTQGVRLEFVHGQLSARAAPDGNAGCTLQRLTRGCAQRRPELWLNSQHGIVIGAQCEGRARPDGSLAPAEAFVGQGEWAAPAPVLMAVEIASRVTAAPATGRWGAGPPPGRGAGALPEPVGVTLDTEPLKSWVR